MIQFPTDQDINNLYSGFPFESLRMYKNDFSINKINGFEGIYQLATLNEIIAWKIILNNKVRHIAKAYAFMMFYYNLGIPDEPYYISPGPTGESVKYFPNFSHDHFLIKDSFDFYADVYFFKYFSAIDDGIWQLLNAFFSLGIDSCEVTWKNLCCKISSIDNNILNSLIRIYDDERYRKGKQVRNSITHRLPVGSQGTGIRREENAIGFGIHEYISAKEIVDITQHLITFGAEAFAELKKICNKSN
jgi:hypothetical protein